MIPSNYIKSNKISFEAFKSLSHQEALIIGAFKYYMKQYMVDMIDLDLNLTTPSLKYDFSDTNMQLVTALQHQLPCHSCHQILSEILEHTLLKS